jgi:TPP-dependent pyruvate/acetoin dehydrogenase alpha subunit
MNIYGISELDLDLIQRKTEDEVEGYLQFSLASPWPSTDDATSWVYSDISVEGRK